MSTGWLWHEIYAWHDTGTAAGDTIAPGMQPFRHYESAESKARFASLVEVSGLVDKLERVKATPATEEDLLRVHTPEHVARIQELSKNPRGGDAGDGMSPFAQGGYEIGCWSAGGAIAAVDAVVMGKVDNAYALVRPPGHHARPEMGMGYCMFANIAVALERARATAGIRRVAVVDWDVHHGNGTEACFETDPEALTISLHQEKHFPLHTGTIEDRGTGEGFGSAINVPLPAGSGRGAYLHAIEQVVAPALRRFQPEIIVIASGFDSAAHDPLGRMLLTSTAYAEMTKEFMALADELCGGKLVICHEGGYNPVYVPYCGVAVLEALSGESSGVEDPYAPILNQWTGQALQPAQQERIAEVARLVGDVPTPTQ